jgi:hypothetical protein
MTRSSIYLTLVLLFSLTMMDVNQVVKAAPPRQAPPGEEYTIQAGDWLTKISEKYYGDPQAYRPIIEATNAKAAEDSTFATVNDPNLIIVGQKLWVPRVQGEGVIRSGDLDFQAIDVEALGIRVAVPLVWPRLEIDDPLLAYAWGASQVSFVSFGTTPGSNAQVGLARILGVIPEDLTGEALGGELSERQVADRTWTIYTRETGGFSSVAAATVQDKVIYQLSLFTASSQKDIILDTILQNFEIIDPSVVQQTISIEAPVSGEALNNPFELRGTTSQYPFKGRLLYRVLDAEGNQVGREPFEVTGRLGSPATFAIPGTYSIQTDGPGTLEVAEVSTADGTIVAIDSVGVMLKADTEGYVITIDDPRPFASVSSPVQIRGKTEDFPVGGTLNYRIVDATGQQLSSGFFEATGGLGLTNLFDGFAEFSVSRNGPGRIEVFDVKDDGSVLTISSVNVWLTTP